MTSKRIVSILLAFVLLAVCVPLSAPSVAAATLMWPVPGHTALSRGWINGSHYGLDIHDSSINGATIVAAMGGRVTHKWTCGTQHYGSYGDCNGFGTGIVIRGNDGRDYNYGHMQAGSIPSNVYVGATVNTGDMIGRVGTTGNSTGPHLHFGISNGGNYWTGYVNPSLETYVYEMGPPTSASISIAKNAYATGEAVTFNMSGNGNTNTLWVYRIDGQWQNHYSNAGNSFELTFGWEGQYKALMETWNGQGSKISNTVYFKIGGPSYATIKASKDTFVAGEDATFTLDADGATNTVWFYYPDGTHEYIQGCTTTCTKKFTKTGKIEALVQSWNDAGNFISERISFTVTEPSKPSSATVKTSKSTYAIDEDVIFTITGNGSTNDLYMARIDGKWSQTRTDVGNSFSLAFGWAGTYEAYVVTKNSAGSYQSTKIQYVIGTPTPTTQPTTAPTTKPTTAPTTKPTTQPTTAPTTKPTTAPTTKPTTQPTTVPTTVPTTQPTTVPTTAPTTAPTTKKPTTKKPTTQATTVPIEQDPCANGHAFMSGICGVCGAADPYYVAPPTESTTEPTVAPTTAPTEPPTADPTVPTAAPSGTAAPGKSGDDSFMLWLWTMIVLAIIFTALVIFVIIKKRKGKAAK